MDKTIKINLDDETFDVEIHGMSLNYIKNLTTISKDVAANLMSHMLLLGADPNRAEDGVNLLLQGKCDIQYILRGCLSEPQNLNS